MHEAHIVDALVKQVVETAKVNEADSVTEVSLVLGDQAGLDEGSIRLYFETISANTIASGAVLKFTRKSGSKDFFIENIEIENSSEEK
jgi:Zn finger protein HypA/HybF involved in hydrogenase expression